MCQQIACGLSKQGVNSFPHHEGLSTKAEWLAGRFPVIATTTSFYKEVYKSSVRFVVHCDLPESIISYYQVN